MRTTLDLPDDLFRRIKAKAALEGISLKDLLARYIERCLRQPGPSAEQPLKRSSLPIIKAKGNCVIPNLTPELQATLESKEDLAKLNRSFGR